jgi:hypothetical protein
MMKTFGCSIYTAIFSITVFIKDRHGLCDMYDERTFRNGRSRSFQLVVSLVCT